MSPTRASSEMSSDGSTSAFWPACSCAQRPGGRRRDLAVERILGRRPRAPARAACRRVRCDEPHRGERRHAREPDAGGARASRGCESAFGVNGPWRATERDVAAQQRARLLAHRARDVRRERVDGDERRDAERDGRHVEQQAAARGAALAPGERQERPRERLERLLRGTSASWKSGDDVVRCVMRPPAVGNRERESGIESPPSGRVDSRSRCRFPIFHDEPVREADHAARSGGERQVVRDEHDVVPDSRLSSSMQLDDAAAGARVEVARGLVGEQDARAVREGARDRDALLLAAGELGREVIDAIAEADARRAARARGRWRRAHRAARAAPARSRAR